MRVFLGIPIPAEVQLAVAEQVKALREQAPAFSWVAPENYHVTMLFIGESSGEQVELIRKALELSPPPVTAFDIELSGMGRFPPSGGPRVVYADVGKGAEGCILLYQDLGRRAELSPYMERRSFHPHVTLARVRRASPGLLLVDLPLRAAFRADRVVLFESLLGVGGARYRRIAEILLPGETSGNSDELGRSEERL